jgi:glycosyltransferase involved in cell wall biosynthesis
VSRRDKGVTTLDEPKITIVIPVYNCEKYVARCLDSILAQTFHGWEAICINDGSTDGSLEILYSYAKRDKRIRVIDGENHGVSHARNLGLDGARGSFIGFVDADDMAEPQMYELLFRAASENRNSVAVCDYETRSEISAKVFDYRADIVPAEKIFPIDDTRFLGLSVCNKLFPKNLFGGLRFQEDVASNEDFYVSAILCSRAQSIVYSDVVLYCYFPNPKSVSKSGFNEKWLTAIKAYSSCYDKIKDTKAEQIKSFCLAKMYKTLLQLRFNAKGTPHEKTAVKQCTSCFYKYLFSFLCDRRISLKTKLGLTYFHFFPSAYYRFRARNDPTLQQ